MFNIYAFIFGGSAGGADLVKVAPPERLADLAKKRADAVVDFLIKEKKIAASRVKAAEPDPKKQDSEKPRAVFEVYK